MQMFGVKYCFCQSTLIKCIKGQYSVIHVALRWLSYRMVQKESRSVWFPVMHVVFHKPGPKHSVVSQMIRHDANIVTTPIASLMSAASFSSRLDPSNRSSSP